MNSKQIRPAEPCRTPAGSNKHEQAFNDIKSATQTHQLWAYPTMTLFLHDRNNQALGILTQDQGERMRPIVYYSVTRGTVFYVNVPMNQCLVNNKKRLTS